jgi:peptidoglycan-associated lipoprotein
MTRFEKYILAAAITLALSACGSSVPLKEEPVIGKGGDNRPEPPRPCCVNPDGPKTDPLNEPGGILSKRSIYFDYDGYTVKEEFRPLLEAHARYLIGQKSRALQLTGHADERGSREYNLAIGAKRADAVRRVLEMFGVHESRLESVSYGEEKPKALGSDEASWAENRRVDLEYR